MAQVSELVPFFFLFFAVGKSALVFLSKLVAQKNPFPAVPRGRTHAVKQSALPARQVYSRTVPQSASCPRRMVAQSSKMAAYKNPLTLWSASPRLHSKVVRKSAEQSPSPHSRTAPQLPAKSARACSSADCPTVEQSAERLPPTRNSQTVGKSAKSDRLTNSRRSTARLAELRPRPISTRKKTAKMQLQPRQAQPKSAPALHHKPKIELLLRGFAAFLPPFFAAKRQLFF